MPYPCERLASIYDTDGVVAGCARRHFDWLQQRANERLVLLDRTDGARFVGTIASSGQDSMTVSIEIRGVSFGGKVDAQNGNASAVLVGTGAALLHCTFHFGASKRVGAGMCSQTSGRLLEATLSD